MQTILLLLLLLSTVFGMGCRRSRGEQIEMRIRTEIQAGMSLPTAAQILDREGFESGYDTANRELHGIIRNVNNDAGMRTNLEITVAFDPQQKASTVTVKRSYTGP